MPITTTLSVPAYVRLVVLLDGTSFGKTALPVAAELAGLFGAGLESVVFDLQSGGDTVVERLGEILDQPGAALACMASHAHHGAGTVFLGSVAFDLLSARGEPVMLVGPAHQSGRSLTAGPVVACVDGSSDSEGSVAVAAAWADRLGVPLEILTVAEPVPEPATGHHTHRHHGPEDSAEAYLDRLAAPWRTDRTVETLVLYNPVSVVDAVADHLAAGPAGLVVVTSRLRGGAARAVLGSTANKILRTSPVPVLVGPRTHRSS
jgi:nucleotide-binding universal stress UspA family protein